MNFIVIVKYLTYWDKQKFYTNKNVGETER